VLDLRQETEKAVEDLPVATAVEVKALWGCNNERKMRIIKEKELDSAFDKRNR
jgi:hypothetical protein